MESFVRVLSCKSCQFKTSKISHLKKHVDSIHRKISSRDYLNVSMVKRCLEEEFNHLEPRKLQSDVGPRTDDVTTVCLVNTGDVTCNICDDTFAFAFLLDLHRKSVHEVVKVKKEKFFVRTNRQSQKKSKCYKKLF